MTSGGPPDTLNERHHLAAMLLAAGYRGTEVAAAVGLHPNRLSLIKSQSPLFRAQVADLQRELRDAVRDDALAILERAAGPAAAFLEALIGDEGAPLRERRQAAEGVLDRHPAIAKRNAPQDATIKITFTTADLASMRAALPPGTTLEHAPRAEPAPATLVPLAQAGYTRQEEDDDAA
jgi:hypothetical protein